MGKVNTQKNTDRKGNLSQSEQMQGKIRLMIVGIAFLTITMLAFTSTSIYNTILSRELLESTTLLNQYRLASRTLTEAVWSYSVTGDTDYLNIYEKELNIDKNRSAAWDGLLQNDITQEEWGKIESIAAMSDSLTHLDTSAIKDVEQGKLQEAVEIVFGNEYQKIVQDINTETEAVVSKIQDRLQTKIFVMTFIQYAIAGIFGISFLFLAYVTLQTILFSKNELLDFIVKISSLMEEFAKGNLDIDLHELEDKHGEIGNMVASISFMKNNFKNMISEISYILEQMGSGNYMVEITENYVGDFEQIKVSLLKILESTRKTLITIRGSIREVDNGSTQLSEAARKLETESTHQSTTVTEIVDLTRQMTSSMGEQLKEA